MPRSLANSSAVNSGFSESSCNVFLWLGDKWISTFSFIVPFTVSFAVPFIPSFSVSFRLCKVTDFSVIEASSRLYLSVNLLFIEYFKVFSSDYSGFPEESQF